jgi:hypothetical protein
MDGQRVSKKQGGGDSGAVKFYTDEAPGFQM